MVLIDRHSIQADGAIKTVALDVLLRAIVATLAQALQFAELEQGSVPFVRHDVIDHVRHHIVALRETEATEWLTP